MTAQRGAKIAYPDDRQLLNVAYRARSWSRAVVLLAEK